MNDSAHQHQDDPLPWRPLDPQEAACRAIKKERIMSPKET
jgi:hypothetical protein